MKRNKSKGFATSPPVRSLPSSVAPDQIIGQRQQRFLSLDGPAIDTEKKTIRISFSSEQPVERWFGKEILSHADGAADLSRLNNGAAFLWNHDPNQLIGVIERAWIDGRKGYAIARFGTSPLAQEIWADVEAGIIRNVSFAYDIGEVRPTSDPDTIIASRWEVYEISLVSIPADPTVGIGRSANQQVSINTKEKNQMATINEPDQMTERETIQAIINLCRMQNIPDSHRDRWIQEGLTIEQARARVFEIKYPTSPEPLARSGADLGFSRREQQKYRLGRALATFGSPEFDGLEREAHIALERQLGQQAKGLLIPVNDLSWPRKRTFLVTGQAATAADLVPEEHLSGNFIDALRDRAITGMLGITMLPGLQGNVHIPKQTATSEAFWVIENQDIPESEAEFGTVALTPKTIGCYSSMSRLTLLQTAPSIETLIRSDFTQVIANGIDKAIFAGSGSGATPRGILNTQGIGSVSLSSNGGPLTWAKLIELKTKVLKKNATFGNAAYAINPDTAGVLETTVKNPVGTDSDFIFAPNPGDIAMGTIGGYKTGVSTLIPNSLTKGNGNNLSAVIFGDWAQVILGSWDSMEVLVNPYGPGFRSGAVEIRAMYTCDIALRHVESFAAITDAVTTS